MVLTFTLERTHLINWMNIILTSSQIKAYIVANVATTCYALKSNNCCIILPFFCMFISHGAQCWRPKYRCSGLPLSVWSGPLQTNFCRCDLVAITCPSSLFLIKKSKEGLHRSLVRS